MEILIICLFISILLPYLGKLPVAFAMNKLGGYDNAHPREQQAKLTGFGARALAAHQNAFESLIVFSAAILCALATNITGEFIQQLAIAHIIARIVYHVLYLYNVSALRSLVWFIALGCALTIIYQCIP